MKQSADEFSQGARPVLGVEVHRHTAPLREDWQAFQRDAAGGPHDTWEWNHAWLETAGRDDDAHIVIGRDAAGGTVFILPLAVRERYGCRVLEWLASEQGNYSSGLFAPAVWGTPALPRDEALLERILNVLPEIDAVHLDKHPASVGAFTSPLAGLSRIPEASPGHSFPLGDDWEDHYKTQFTSNARAKLRRSERRLSDGGNAIFESVGGEDAKCRFMDEAIAQKAEFFDERGIPNCFEAKGVRDFFGRLARLPEEGSDLSARLYVCRKDGALIAAKMGVVYKDTYYGIISSTTSAPIRRFGPGSVLFKNSVEFIAKEGLQTLDCGAGEDDTKQKWCIEERERLHLVVPVTANGRVYVTCLKAALKAKLIIKNNPGYWERYKRARQWMAGLMSTKTAVPSVRSGSASSGQA